MAVYKCDVCDYCYDESKEGVQWADLPDDWVCPVCGSAKAYFKLVGSTAPAPPRSAEAAEDAVDKYRRTADDLETLMADIHLMAETGTSIIEPMRTKKPVASWDDILIRGAQMARLPRNDGEPVATETVIGHKTKQPLVLQTPVYISHMSFGALSRETKIALAKGSALAGTAVCSGEGGILPEELANAGKYIFEYVPNQYSVTEENFRRVDAIEIKIGQSSKPGMGGHLPGAKVTAEIAAVRGVPPGKDVISPAHFRDIATPEDLRKKIAWLREASGGKPIGVKIAAGHIEADLAFILKAKPDFITIDGRPGATGASPKYVKAATSVPTIFALHRARRFLDSAGANDVSLIITGGLRVSSDFAKALALGADAVAIATAALMACGCQQYRVCHTGRCPVGIATQDPELRKRLDIERSATRLANFLRVCTSELKDFARLTGNDNVHSLSVGDLCTTNSEISGHTAIEHA
ncbi:MAG: FMN-binding glutamate synthase family protein [candidate division Zixibacteria bacterium]|nr:FMN-binding glutamate synthase family protein [candidate division Zixibacteria bacterium]